MRVFIISLFTYLIVFGYTLPDTPASLVEKSNRIRQNQELVWEPETGKLGNLKTINLDVDKGCSVRIVSGDENKILSSLNSVRIQKNGPENSDDAKHDINLTLKVGITKDSGTPGHPCLVLQISTANDFIVRGDNVDILFDHFQATYLRLFLNPSNYLRVWYEQSKIGMLTLTSNASASLGGNGKVNFLGLDSSQSSSKFFFHNMDANHVGVSATVPNVQFSIRIISGVEAMYSNPANTPGKFVKLYPVWIEGKVQDLKMSAGRVNPLAITTEIKKAGDLLRHGVLDQVGMQPNISNNDDKKIVLKPAPREQVADAFASYLPIGMSFTDVQVLKDGGAVEGLAKNKKMVDDFLALLVRSADVSHAQIAYTKPQGNEIFFRILYDLDCDSSDLEKLKCKAKDGSYDSEMIRLQLQSVFGAEIKNMKYEIRKEISDDTLLTEATASEAQARNAVDRIRKENWLQVSSTTIGKDSFSIRAKLMCMRLEPRPLKHLCLNYRTPKKSL